MHVIDLDLAYRLILQKLQHHFYIGSLAQWGITPTSSVAELRCWSQSSSLEQNHVQSMIIAVPCSFSRITPWPLGVMPSWQKLPPTLGVPQVWKSLTPGGLSCQVKSQPSDWPKCTHVGSKGCSTSLQCNAEMLCSDLVLCIEFAFPVWTYVAHLMRGWDAKDRTAF